MMKENYDIRTTNDIQTPLLSSSLLQEADQSKFSILEESGGETTSRYPDAGRSKSRSDSAESFLRHTPSPIDSINDVHQASFAANRLLPRDAPFYQSKVRKTRRYRYHKVQPSKVSTDRKFIFQPCSLSLSLL